MATLFLLLVVLTGQSSAFVFEVCHIFNRAANCYDSTTCLPGTAPFNIAWLPFSICGAGRSCCTGTPLRCENDPMCGQWGPTARLAFSQTALPRQAPWQVSLRRRSTSTTDNLTLENTIHYAGGVLIQNKWVLTDVMALLSTGQQNSNETILRDTLVVMGDYNIASPEIYNNVPQEQWSEIKSFSYHPDFPYSTTATLADVFRDAGFVNRSKYQGNAFCLIELKTPVVYNDWVRPICLPQQSVSCLEGKDCRVTGWGLTENFAVKNLLQVSYLNKFSKPACEAIEYYRNDGTETTLPANTMCAADEKGTYSCVGDFGGPLACDDPYNENRGTLHGIMTFNIGCNKDSTVMISNVPAVVDWVWNTCEASYA